ncbi:MAG: cupin protein [Ignavibacteria bacterium]|nr:cupin protein [Ignavibacteria bacterium]
MHNIEIIKSQPLMLLDIIEYESQSIVSRTILKKNTGNVCVMSFDISEGLVEKTIPFDTFIQIIEGRAEIEIDSKIFILDKGSSIVIPAHSPHIIKANEKFKMISTIIKDGYN